MQKQRAILRLLLPTYVFVVAMAASSLYAVAPPAQNIFPGSSGQVMLIRNTIVAINHANITGNYTVLRDLASERFRKQNTAADLANTFAKLRKLKFDLSPILVTEPQLTQQPAEDTFRDRLQLVGYFSTRPQAVQFSLIFQRIEAGWMIDEISVVIAPVQATPTPMLQRP